MKLITVIDGDTFVAVDARGTHRRLRLHGVDCPEMGQKNGPQAKHFVHQFVSKKWVHVSLLGKDRYRRHLATVHVEGNDLAYALVEAGLAYPLTGNLRLKFAALGAKVARRGVHASWWQSKPWTWRSRNSVGRFVHYWSQRIQRRRSKASRRG